MDGHTVLNKTTPSDGFRETVARAIIEKARDTNSSNPDAWGAQRHLQACKHLAEYIRGLPLWDSRFRQLLQVSPDSDVFALNTGGSTFIQILGVDIPAPPDIDAVFTEFVIACGTRPAAAPGDSELVKKLQEQVTTNQRAACDRENALQAEVAKREREYAELSQEASNLRGEVKRLRASDGGQADALSRRVAELEGLLDVAHRDLAKASRTRKKTAKVPA